MECGISYDDDHCEKCGSSYVNYDAVNIDNYLKAIGADVTVNDASLSPTAAFDLRQGDVQPPPSSSDGVVTVPVVTKSAGTNVESNAKSGRHPWHAAVVRSADMTLLCSGVLVGDRVVVTAANCVHGKGPHEIIVRLGQLDLYSTLEASQPVYQGNIAGIDIHPSQYDL